jgi:hypothetical protein
MAYSNYFNQQGNAATYSNVGTSYINGAGGYGSHCAMSYTNYANAWHAAPTAFDIGVTSSLFNQGAPVKDSVNAIKALRNALYTVSVEKVDYTTGKAQNVNIYGSADAGANPTASDWPNSQISNAQLAPNMTMRAAQAQALANVTKALWDVVEANNPAYTKPIISVGDKAVGQTIQNLTSQVQTMANCVQSNYKNTRFYHNGYAFTAGEDSGDLCYHNTYANGSYYPYVTCTQGYSGQNVAAQDTVE